MDTRCRSRWPTSRSTRPTMDAVDYRIIAATQAGLPLVEEPVVELACQLGLMPEEPPPGCRPCSTAGAIRRIGVVPNHYRLGLRSKRHDGLGRA